MYGYRRRRWTFWFWCWFFGTLAVIVVGLAVEQLVDPSPVQPCCAVSVGPSSSPASPTAAPSPGRSPGGQPSGGPSLTGPVQVVQGSQQINGVELGFPHSTVGAVSAADADVTEVFSTLDPDRAAAVMRMIADPSFTDGPQQAAKGPVNARKYLGLPETGPVPAGASVQVQPMEYQVRGISADTVTVLLLCDYTATTPDQGTSTRSAVFPVSAHWAEGDWKVLPPEGAVDTRLEVEPGSPQAAALGWQQLEPAGS